MDNFIYAINATLPIFIVIILGRLLYKWGIIGDGFVAGANKYVFYCALPVLVFRDLGCANVADILDFSYIGFCFAVTLVFILGVWFFTDIFMKNKSQQGAFIQASYRSSAAILGMAFINNMYGDAGIAPLMIVGAVPLFNIFAVIILTLKGENDGKKPDMKTTIINVFKNPILISILVSLPFAFFNPPLPTFVTKTIDTVAGSATPLALIAIGATFEGRKALKKIKPTLIATLIKLLLLAGIFLPLAVWMGFRDQGLIGILIMLASPATPSCYIMAKNTNNDDMLTASIIVATTLFSSITLTMWIYLLRSFGFI